MICYNSLVRKKSTEIVYSFGSMKRDEGHNCCSQATINLDFDFRYDFLRQKAGWCPSLLSRQQHGSFNQNFQLKITTTKLIFLHLKISLMGFIFQFDSTIKLSNVNLLFTSCESRIYLKLNIQLDPGATSVYNHPVALKQDSLQSNGSRDLGFDSENVCLCFLYFNGSFFQLKSLLANN